VSGEDLSDKDLRDDDPTWQLAGAAVGIRALGPEPTGAGSGEAPTWRVPSLGERPRREVPAPAPGSEHGDRGCFVTGVRERLAGGVPTNPPHRPVVLASEPGRDDEADLAPDDAEAAPVDLVGSFVRAVEDVGGVCHRVEGEVPDALLDHLVAELDAWEMVVSAEPEAVALGERLSGRGVEVSPATPEAAVAATVGVTSAVAGIAATGSLVLDSRRAGGRGAALLPAIHLCVLPVERLLATPGDLFRSLGAAPEDLPPALVVETGASRAGDIEQLLALGTSRPIGLHLLLVS